MLHAVRALLQRRRRRVAAVVIVVVLGAAVTAAHSSVADHHMGEAASMCLAVLAVAGAAAAALPSLGRELPRSPRPADVDPPRQIEVTFARVAWHARGDPAVLQVFRL